jgi:hypothetical protein
MVWLHGVQPVVYGNHVVKRAVRLEIVCTFKRRGVTFEPRADVRDHRPLSRAPVDLRDARWIVWIPIAWAATPLAIDAQHTTAWLHRQIMFEHEPLERVASEFNRYASKPFEITTPALGALEISGVFATDDTAAFIAFLRRLDGVRVEITATRIRVLQD